MTEYKPFVDNFEIPDPALTNKIVTHLKAQGIFDQFRRECMADVDTKPAYQNLRQRVEGSVRAFLVKNPWKPEMNKNQMRELLRKHIQSGAFLESGVDRIVDQVVNPKIYSMFLPKVEEAVRNCLKMDENNKPMFVPPPKTDLQPEFQAPIIPPRARVPAPLIGPRMPLLTNIKSLVTTPIRLVEDDFLSDDKNGDSEQDDSSQANCVVDQNDAKTSKEEKDDDDEEEEDDDEEESPPFELHSENDPLLHGVRTDSDSSSDDGLVTTIVDDNLEETIEQQNNIIEEAKVTDQREDINKESDESSEESSSDEYVIPKTPTINMEGSDGSVIEFGTISEYKEYQTKFDEETFENVEEEVVSTQWDEEKQGETSEQLKDERSSIEESSAGESHRRKFESESFEEESNSSVDKGTNSDEGKLLPAPTITHNSDVEEDCDDENNSNSDLTLNEQSSDTEKSGDGCSPPNQSSDSEGGKKSRSTHTYRDQTRRHKRDWDQSQTSNTRDSENENNIKISFDKNGDTEQYTAENDKDYETNECYLSTDSDDYKSKYKERKPDHSGDKNNTSKSESAHKNKDLQDEKYKKRHESYEKSNEKRSSESSYKSDKKDRSKYSHGSSKHHHRSPEKHRSDGDSKFGEKSDKNRSHDKKEKESKEKSKQKYREHCKSRDQDSKRRSSDRDSSGPSSRSTSSSCSRMSSSRTQSDTSADTSDKTSSNSDNVVSDQTEPIEIVESHLNSTHLNSIEENAHPTTETGGEYELKPDIEQKDSVPCSDENLTDNSMKCDNNFSRESNENEIQIIADADSPKKLDTNCVDTKVFDGYSLKNAEVPDCHNNEDLLITSDDNVESNDENIFDSSHCTNLVHDSSSEKENIEQVLNCSDQIDQSKAKFKKPKIAANIFEAKKIMQARRDMKRLEKKKIHLTSKVLTEDGDIANVSPNTDKDNELFEGFHDLLSDKIEKYNCIIKSLNDEIINISDVKFPHIETRWMEFDNDYDDYISETLSGKVNRKIRICVPQICEEFYSYDSEQNVYTLRDNFESIAWAEEVCDGNLKKSKNYIKEKDSNDTHSRELMGDCDSSIKSKCSNSSLGSESSEVTSSLHKDLIDNRPTNSQSSMNKSKNSPKKEETEKTVNISENSPPVKFSLTFNQTYEEILKDREVSMNEQTEESPCKRRRTVVKITNNTSSKDVMKNEVIATITKAEPKVDEKTVRVQKGAPMISRIKKTKKAANSNINGTVSPDSTTNSEEESQLEISSDMISDVIGILHKPSNQVPTPGKKCSPKIDKSPEKKNLRNSKPPIVNQRYDSSDLYKPRLQLSSRRIKSQSIEDINNSMDVVVGRKRPTSLEVKTTPPKRRR